MLDEVADGRFFVRAGPHEPVEAVVERFGSGWRLSSWSLDEASRVALGVHTAVHLAETAWWRHVDGEASAASSGRGGSPAG